MFKHVTPQLGSGAEPPSVALRYIAAMAPTVVRDGPFRLFFSSEEPRIHVHVAHPDGEAKFWLTPEVSVATATWSFAPPAPRGTGHRRSAHSGGPRCLAPSLPPLNSPTSPSMGFGCSSGRKSSPAVREVPLVQAGNHRAAVRDRVAIANHLYGRCLDVDLSVESVRNPEAFPLVSAPAVI